MLPPKNGSWDILVTGAKGKTKFEFIYVTFTIFFTFLSYIPFRSA